MTIYLNLNQHLYLAIYPVIVEKIGTKKVRIHSTVNPKIHHLWVYPNQLHEAPEYNYNMRRYSCETYDYVCGEQPPEVSL